MAKIHEALKQVKAAEDRKNRSQIIIGAFVVIGLGYLSAWIVGNVTARRYLNSANESFRYIENPEREAGLLDPVEFRAKFEYEAQQRFSDLRNIGSYKIYMDRYKSFLASLNKLYEAGRFSKLVNKAEKDLATYTVRDPERKEDVSMEFLSRVLLVDIRDFRYKNLFSFRKSYRDEFKHDPDPVFFDKTYLSIINALKEAEKDFLAGNDKQMVARLDRSIDAGDYSAKATKIYRRMLKTVILKAFDNFRVSYNAFSDPWAIPGNKVSVVSYKRCITITEALFFRIRCDVNRLMAEGLSDSSAFSQIRSQWDVLISETGEEYVKFLYILNKAPIDLKYAAYVKNQQSPLEEAKTDIDNGNYPDAVEKLEKLMKIEPGFYEIPYNLGNAYDEIMQFDKAEANYLKAIEKFQYDMHAYKSLMQLEQKKIDLKIGYGKFTSALKLFHKAEAAKNVKKKAEKVAALLRKAKNLLEEPDTVLWSRYELAAYRRTLPDAAGVAGKVKDAAHNINSLTSDEKSIANAVKTLKVLAAENRTDPMPLLRAGLLLTESGRPEASAILRAALKRHNRNAEAYAALCTQMLADMGASIY